MNEQNITRRSFLRRATLAIGATLYAHINGRYKIALGAGPVAYKLRILHTNDHHSWIEPTNVTLREGTDTEPSIRRDFGGVARRKTLIDQLRTTAAPDENILLLDTGDVFQGTLYFTQYNGQADLFFYNGMSYDAVIVGNHEFDKGQVPIRDFIIGANFPLLSANINVLPTAVLASALAPTDVAVAGKLGKRLIIAKGTKKIGIFGLTPPKTAALSNVGADVSFSSNLATIAQAQVDALKAEGAHFIVGLTHVGYAVDLQLAAQVRGIDIIVGGHSHTPLLPTNNTALLGTNPDGIYPTIITDPDGKVVVVTTVWKWGRWLGDITLGFSAEGSLSQINGVIRPVWAGGLGNPNRSLLTGEEAEIPPDPVFQTQIDTVYKPPLLELQAKVIGRTSVLLDGDRINVRNRETNLGNLIADVMLQKAQLDGGQIAIMNSSGISKSIPVGDITLARVIEALQFDNTLARVDLTGAQILAVLENAVSQVDFQNPNNSSGRFVQVSGLRFTWATRPPTGSRILSVMVQSLSVAGSRARAGIKSSLTPIDLNATYRVITSNFMLGGGDGYTILTQGQNKYDTGILLVDMLSDYLSANSPVSASIEGRIKVGGEIYLPNALQSIVPN